MNGTPGQRGYIRLPRGNQVSWSKVRKPEETRIIPLNLVLEVYEKATSQVERSNVQSTVMEKNVSIPLFHSMPPFKADWCFKLRIASFILPLLGIKPGEPKTLTQGHKTQLHRGGKGKGEALMTNHAKCIWGSRQEATDG